MSTMYILVDMQDNQFEITDVLETSSKARTLSYRMKWAERQGQYGYAWMIDLRQTIWQPYHRPCSKCPFSHDCMECIYKLV